MIPSGQVVKFLVSYKSALIPGGVAVKLRALPTLEKEYTINTRRMIQLMG